MIEKVICSPHHIQFRGKVIVNYYPTKGTIYINGMYKSIKGSEKEAVKIAKDPSLIKNKTFEKTKRKANTRKVRKKLYYELHKTKCFVCGKDMDFEETTLEHIIPLSKGGANRIDNYALSHEKCNQERGGSI